MLIRSRIVYPVSRPPVENGAIVVHDGRVVALGRFEDLRAQHCGEVIDVGDSILLPGLVNAHCHLDYTAMARLISPPSGFTDWVNQLIGIKASWSYTEYAESWIRGLHQQIDCGTTTLADIEAVPELLPDVLAIAPIRVMSFREMITVRSRANPAQIVATHIQELEHLPHGRHTVGLSPHAPYSTSQELVQVTAAMSRGKGWRWTMHVAESTDETEMFVHARGSMFDWLKGQRDMNDCGNGTPVRWLAETGALGPELLMVHANCLATGEPDLLGRHGVHVVHCPRSHDYFSHPAFRYDSLKRAGVNICLGTDSLVSVRAPRGTVPVLDLFAEMQAFQAAHPAIGPGEILSLATRAGAAALGLAGEVGELSPGSAADLITLPFSAPLSSAVEAIVGHSGSVGSSMVAGQWIRRSGF